MHADSATPSGDALSTPWTFAEQSTSLHSQGAAVTLVDGTTFVVSAASGDVDGTGAHGLFMSDTRILERLVLTVDGSHVEPLTVIPNGPFSATFIGRFPSPDHGVDWPFSVIRRRHVGRGMREDIEIRNHAPTAAAVKVELDVDTDFASLFAVKSGQLPDAVGIATRHFDHSLQLVDAAETTTVTVRFSQPPDVGTEWSVKIPAGGSWHLCAEVHVRIGDTAIEPSYLCGDPIADAVPVRRLQRWRTEAPRVTVGDPRLVRAVDQAVEDLGSLRIFDPEHPDRVIVAAGAPWFMTLFGRDSLLTAWMALLVDHQLARGVLRELADLQGTVEHPLTEEQPGRILHEIRFDAATSRSLGGRNRYYGTADATPLFVMLVAEYWRWTGDRDLVEQLLPHCDRALDWTEEFGDSDGDGFIEYHRTNDQGLQNQGWKDSFDGIRYGDGRIAEAPIALCEVQAYLFGALTGRAEIAEALGDHRVAARRRAQAAELKRRFDDAFWLDDQGTYAIGLDADKRPIDSVTSNPGHCLWTGIADERRSARIAEALLAPASYTGWGIRTLDSANPAYNPLSYHCGSVWPHDTAIAVAGLMRYGHRDEAARIAFGLLDASTFSGGRLPELFAGFARDDLPAPVPYPSSCSPQAWAAAAPLLVIRSLLGLNPHLPDGRVDVSSSPPTVLEGLRIEQILIGTGRVSIDVHGGSVHITGLDPDIVVAPVGRDMSTDERSPS